MARNGVETGMEIRRFFADASDVCGDEVTIGGDEFVHMTKVLRHKPGYKIVVCPGDGSELDCTLTSIGTDSALAHIDGRRQTYQTSVFANNFILCVCKTEHDKVFDLLLRLFFWSCHKKLLC